MMIENKRKVVEMMVKGKNYKYNPEEFKNIMALEEDIESYYLALEKYKKDKTFSNEIYVENHLEILLFTIKHREVEGNLTHITASELREYMRGLLYD